MLDRTDELAAGIVLNDLSDISTTVLNAVN